MGTRFFDHFLHESFSEAAEKSTRMTRLPQNYRRLRVKWSLKTTKTKFLKVIFEPNVLILSSHIEKFRAECLKSFDKAFRAKILNFLSLIEKFPAECLKSFDGAFRAKRLNFLFLKSEIKHEIL